MLTRSTEPMPAPALYRWAGEMLEPQASTIGPWALNTQSGAAVGALLATLAQSASEDPAWVPANIQIEFARPIPMTCLRPQIEVVRRGRRLQIIRVLLIADGRQAASASLVSLRPEHDERAEPPAPHPKVHPESLPREIRDSPYFVVADYRLERGSFDELGPGAAWLRMHHAVIADVPLTAFAAAVFAADSGSGLSSLVSRNEWRYPNVTLSLHLRRRLSGVWVSIASETQMGATGLAQVNTVIGDLAGEAGYAHQTICLQRRL